jgi:hypothetical protein
MPLCFSPVRQQNLAWLIGLLAPEFLDVQLQNALTQERTHCADQPY